MSIGNWQNAQHSPARARARVCALVRVTFSYNSHTDTSVMSILKLDIHIQFNTLPSMDFHKRAGLMYKLDKQQLSASQYKGLRRGHITKQMKYFCK